MLSGFMSKHLKNCTTHLYECQAILTWGLKKSRFCDIISKSAHACCYIALSGGVVWLLTMINFFI